MSAKTILGKALAAIEEAKRKLDSARKELDDDYEVRNAMKDIEDAEYEIKRAIRELPGE